MTDLYTYQAAITAGGTVTVPPGTYTMSQPLILPQDTPLTFDGYGVTVVLDAGCAVNRPAPFFVFDPSADYQTWYHLTWRGFTIDGTHAVYPTYGWRVIASMWTHCQNNLHDILFEDLDITLPPTRTSDAAEMYVGIELASHQSTGVDESRMEHITLRHITVHGGDQGFFVGGNGGSTSPWGANVWADDINLIDCHHIPSTPAADYLSQNGFQVGGLAHGGSVLVSECTAYGAGDSGLEVNGFADTVIEHCTATDGAAIGFLIHNFNVLVDPAVQTILFDDCHAVNTGPHVYHLDGTWDRRGFDAHSSPGTDIGAVIFNDCTSGGYSEGNAFFTEGVRSFSFAYPGSSNPLFDGTLSLKVAGVEYAAVAGALQYESVGPGGFGPASFDVGGTPVERTNYCTNSSFEMDTNSDGVADGWNIYSAPAGTPVWSRVAALTGYGGYAQRCQYTGIAGDSSSWLGLNTDPISDVGSFAPGDAVTLSATMKGSVAGCTAYLIIYWRKADGSSAGSTVGPGISPTGTAARYSQIFTAPALASRALWGWEVSGIHNGDTLDITTDDVLFEKSAVLAPYFDGSHSGFWTPVERTNYCTNPSFELDSNADGLADGWGLYSAPAGTPVWTRVAPLTGHGAYAQRVQYTGVAGDTGGYLDLMTTDLSGVGTFAPGDVVALSFTAKGSLAGCAIEGLIYWRRSDGSSAGSSNVPFTPTTSPTRFSLTVTAPANASQARYGLEFYSIDNGDTLDITTDDVLFEKSAVLNPYFDGSYPGCLWAGAQNASTSKKSQSDPDPFDVSASYPHLVNEAAVVAKHDGVVLYEGHIVGDPTIAKLENGESLISVECGGLLDKAKYRQDYGSTSVDTTYDNWARHRASDKGFADTIDGKLRLDVNDGQTFTAGDIAGIFYRVNQGIVTSPDDEVLALDFEYDLALASAAWHCDIWAAPYYVDTLVPADWTTGLWAQSETTAEGTAHVTGLPAGTRCVAFVSWVSGNGTSLAKRHAEITNLRVNCFDAGGATPTVDQAMVDCGVVTGLATASDTETIGNPLAQCTVPPSTTHADGLDKFASMYEAPVDWGFWDSATLRVKKRLNSPADDVAIRALAGAGTAPAAYLLDATTPAFDYDVHKYEEGKFDYVRAIFTGSRTNRVATPNPSGTTWPADWYRFPTSHVTAVAGTFQAVVDSGQITSTFVYPSSDPFSLRTNEITQVGYRETIKAVAVPSGTTCRVEMQATFLAEGGGETGTDSHISTFVGPLTNEIHNMKGTFDVPAGTAAMLVEFFITDSAGTGTSTVQISGVDVHDLFPGGMVRTVCAPSEPPADADVKVGTLDLTSRGDMTVDRAFATATQALAWIDSTLETGTIEVFSPTVPIYGGGTKLAAYVRASDWVECAQVDGHAPLWISSSHVDVDAGVTTLTIEPYPFDVAESDFGHAHMGKLRRWKKARRGMYRRQKAALRKAQAKENRTKLGAGHKRRIHYI